MARPRKDPADAALPPRVSRHKYSFVWKPAGSKKTISLAPLSTPIGKLWEIYERESSKYSTVMTFEKLWALWLDSPAFCELAPRTQKDYGKHEKMLIKVFGKMKADDIKIEQVRIYMDKRGVQSKTQANHERSSMSRVFSWGMERGYVKNNPCQGIRKFRIESRDVYVTDDEYEAIYTQAPPAIKVAMEIAYLCASRLGDILALKYEHVTDLGIFIKQGKTAKKQIKSWTPRLKEALQAAVVMNGGSDKVNWVIGDGRSPVHEKTFNTWWLEARRSASAKIGVPLEHVHFHDLKAKGISDYEGSSRDKQLFSGHKTESQVLVYDRKVKVTPTLDPKACKKNA